MPFSFAFAMDWSSDLSRREIGPERVGSPRGDAAPELDGPRTFTAEFRTPRPEPARGEVERVLVGEPDGAVHLVDEAGGHAGGFAHTHLGDRDLEPGVAVGRVSRAERLLGGKPGRRHVTGDDREV